MAQTRTNWQLLARARRTLSRLAGGQTVGVIGEAFVPLSARDVSPLSGLGSQGPSSRAVRFGPVFGFQKSRRQAAAHQTQRRLSSHAVEAAAVASADCPFPNSRCAVIRQIVSANTGRNKIAAVEIRTLPAGRSR